MTSDLVVVGSGFAAYEVARTAAARGRRVLVVERGGEELATADPALSRVPSLREPVQSGGFDFGVEVPPAFDGVPRYIGLGGTSELWSGKWRPLDAIDFARVHGDRHWPFDRAALDPWYAGVAADYGWPDWSGDTAFAPMQALAARHGLRLIDIYEEVPPVRLRARWRALADAGRVSLHCGTTVRKAAFERRGDRLQSLTLSNAAGTTRLVEAGHVVIAAGGIESIHVAHDIRASRPTSAPLPERYEGFADHPKAFVGAVDIARRHDLADYLQDAHTVRRRLIAFGLPEDDLVEASLGNHTMFLTPDHDGPGRRLRVMVSLEQFPEPDNFVATAPTRAVAWHVSAATRDDARRFLDIVRPRLETLFGPAGLVPDVPLRGASHHAAALPIGDPGRGFVDRDLRFHDVANLSCVSSAVFPVAGSANPTMTIVALARRLGESLTA